MITKAVIPKFEPLPPEAEQIKLLDPGEPAPAPKKKRAKVKGVRAAERSMDVLRKDGYLVGKTEHWNPWAGMRGPDGKPFGMRQDLFGFIDLVALGGGKIIGVQVTKGMLPQHVEKIAAKPEAKRWLEAPGGQLMIHHWRVRQRNGIKYWDLEVIEIKP